MKILHFCFSRSWGGLEKNSFDLALAQHKAGHEVLYACRKNYSLERELLGVGIPCVAFENIVKYIDLRVIYKLRRIVTSGGYAVAHGTHTEDLGLIVPAIAGLSGVKLFFTLQMSVPAPKKDLYHRWEYGRIGKIFVSSAILKQSAIENLPITEDKIMVVPYGIDLEIYKPSRADGFRKSIGYDFDKIVLGILARLDPPKGQMEAIQAMPQILAKYPNARLMLVGDESVDHHGAETKRLRGEVERLGLGNFVNFVSDKRGAEQARYLNAMDLFLSPSHFETYSTSMMMAQLCSVPILGTNAGGTPEQLGWGKYGSLFEPKNPESLAQCVEDVLENLPAAREKAEKLRLLAVERFDMQKIMEKINAEYLK